MSPRTPLLIHRTLHACRRAASAALLALQVTFVVSPIFEGVGETRLDTHAEQQGLAHLMPHDESNCVVCSVRTTAMDATPVAPDFPMATGRRQVVAEVAVESGVDTRPGQHSRAPPVLG